MSPTLNKEENSVFLDVVLVSKTSEFSKGDIVLLSDPVRTERTKLVKRVADVSISGNSVFVLGDNANHSTDSRHFGSVPSVMVEGVVKAIVFPPWRWTSFGQQ
jgi:type IV secretory pathway protease TraF